VGQYYFPAEWDRHRATWLSWPHNAETWPGERLGRVQAVYREFIRFLAEGEDVHVSVPDVATATAVQHALHEEGAHTERIWLHVFPTNDAWCRDHGPSFVFDPTNAHKYIVNWGFNSWGSKYPYALDNEIPARVAEAQSLPLLEPGMILEGGSVDVNGAGCMLTTTSCLLAPTRNPDLSKDEISETLMRYYGVDQVVWLGEGIAGDDTDGHVDDISRFVATDHVVTVIEENPADENFKPLQENLEKLRSVRLKDGAPLRITTLPMPEPVYDEGLRLPASYANFYIANAGVVVPLFGCPQDGVAMDILRGCFERPVMGLPARDIVYGLGTFHCLSQQEPAVRKEF
jgi:agmatine deiminase